jgi:drug/metabolite transporter (DMT)-like permease
MNWLYFLTGSALWGGSFVAIKFVLNDFSPLTGVLLRLAVALAFFTVYFKIAGVRFRLSK